MSKRRFVTACIGMVACLAAAGVFAGRGYAASQTPRDHNSNRAAKGERGTSHLDPICRMHINEAKAREKGLVIQRQGETFFFCSQQCKEKFEKNPAVTAPAPAPHTAGKGLRVGTALPRGVLGDLAGVPTPLPDAVKGQVAVIHFWAAGCSSCREEMPLLDELYRKYRGKGMTVVAVNVGQPKTAAREAVSGLGVSYRILVDPDKKLASLYEVSAVPRTIILDRSGTVRYKIIGPAPADMLRKYVFSLLER